ncbi:MAG TPA: MOSC domain-containing protein [Roseiflexaceae bacterium]|nr:MOSC domain-containing protein [Roseiflexaceae bacterium]
MKLISVNVGQPRAVEWQGRLVETGIFKAPVAGPVALRGLNLDGDRQADLSAHGGAHKAVYVYPSEHYAFWRAELPDLALPWGMFGENFTSEGLREDVAIGDRFRIGTAEVMVSEPRVPCYKLGLKFGRADMVKRFLASGRTGFYLMVLKEGVVQAGDRIEPIGRADHGITVADLTRIYAGEQPDPASLRQAVDLEALSGAWRSFLRDLLERTGS